MTAAKTGDTVRVHYTGSMTDGSIFDSSVGGEPLEFTLGQKQMIPGFEEAVMGMTVGETRTQVIPFVQAYGPHHAELIFEVDRSKFPAEAKPEVGQQLEMSHDDGRSIRVTVAQVAEDKVTLDVNHPLAGKDLVFKIELVEIVAPRA